MDKDWYQWDIKTCEFVKTDILSQGPQGEPLGLLLHTHFNDTSYAVQLCHTYEGRYGLEFRRRDIGIYRALCEEERGKRQEILEEIRQVIAKLELLGK